MKPVRSAALSLLLFPVALSAQQSHWLQAALQSSLTEFSAAASNPQKPLTTRDLTNAALVNLMAGGSASISEAWIERAYATQEMDHGSTNFGELKWSTGDSAITDKNAIEFGTQAIGPLYLSYGKQLSAGFKARMVPHLAAALAALSEHNVPVSYTNIYLMNLTSRMLLGQVTGDRDAIKEAEQQLDDWLEYTRRNGIHEFDSPTYYAADLDSLVEGYRYAASAAERSKFERALDFFWMDIAANDQPGAQRMAGAYSRDYDFLRGHGGMNLWLTDAGWAAYSPSKADFEKVFVLDNDRPGGYRPKPEAAALTAQFPREVISSWDGDARHLRFVWIGRELSLGCASGDYGPQDKLFNATFSGSPELGQISIVPDTVDSPYGLVKSRDKSGHNKPTHQPLHAACVERDGAALVTLDLNPAALPVDSRGFATNLLLPTEAVIAVNGQPRSLAVPGAFTLQTGDLVTASVGHATVAIRLLHVDDLPEQRAVLSLSADAEGLAHHVVRWKLTHLEAGQTSRSKHLRVALLIVAREGLAPDIVERELRAAKVSDQLTGNVWSVQAELKGMRLEVARSAEDSKQILSQLVNGASIPAAVLSVNGKELADSLQR